jgi:hypothetical protein
MTLTGLVAFLIVLLHERACETFINRFTGQAFISSLYSSSASPDAVNVTFG